MQRHSHCRSIVHAAPTGSSLCASFRRIFCAGASRSSRAPSTTWPHGSRPPGRRSTLRPPRGYRNLLSLLRAGVADAILAHAAPAIQGEVLALAIALLTASTAAAADAASDSPDAPGAMRHFCVATGGACAGQFLDARLERRGTATVEESLEMTRLKSGSLGTFAAGFAARIAGAGPGDARIFEALGCNLFTFAQLVDD